MRLISSLIAHLNIKNSFCKDRLKSIRFHLILLGKKKNQISIIAYHHSDWEPYQLFTYKAHCFYTLYQTYKNDEEQIECEITRDLYQMQINIPINL